MQFIVVEASRGSPIEDVAQQCRYRTYHVLALHLGHKYEEISTGATPKISRWAIHMSVSKLLTTSPTSLYAGSVCYR
jgi:hypothetical protein